MVTGCLRDFALAFTLMTVPAAHESLSFPPVWYLTWDSNPHLTGSKPVASSVGLIRHKRGSERYIGIRRNPS